MIDDEPKDASNEPLEIKIITAASDHGFVNITPEKCERIRRLIRPFIAEILTEKTIIVESAVREHSKCIQRFLLEMYQTMVDPVEEFDGNIQKLCALLLKRARDDRELLRRMQ